MRVKTYFTDYDRLHCGRCTSFQFARALNQILPDVAPADVAALVAHFTEDGMYAREPQVVNYAAFVEAVDEVFGMPHLEGQPEAKVPLPGAALLCNRGFRPGRVIDEDRFWRIMYRIALLTETRGVDFTLCFEGDRCAPTGSNISRPASGAPCRGSGKITPGFFLQRFPFRRNMPEADLQVLMQRYCPDRRVFQLHALEADLAVLVQERRNRVQPPEVPKRPTLRRPETAHASLRPRMPLGQVSPGQASGQASLGQASLGQASLGQAWGQSQSQASPDSAPASPPASPTSPDSPPDTPRDSPPPEEDRWAPRPAATMPARPASAPATRAGRPPALTLWVPPAPLAPAAPAVPVAPVRLDTGVHPALVASAKVLKERAVPQRPCSAAAARTEKAPLESRAAWTAPTPQRQTSAFSTQSRTTRGGRAGGRADKPAPTSGGVLAKIASLVARRHLRTSYWFQDFDKLRRGVCTFGQVRTTLGGILRMELDEEDYDCLLETYATPDSLFRYKEFCADVDEMAEGVKELYGYGASLHPQALMLLDQVRERISKRCHMRRLEIRGAFRDFGHTRAGRVTRSQFIRIMSVLALQVNEADLKLLCLGYCDSEDGTLFNYATFCDDIDQLVSQLGPGHEQLAPPRPRARPGSAPGLRL